MAVVFPIQEDAETLHSHASVSLNFSSEDVEQLESACNTLIADAKTISAFVFPTCQIDDGTSAHQRLPDYVPPVFHARVSVSAAALDVADMGNSDVPLNRPRGKLRQHDSTLRDLRQRLYGGRTVLKGLNEKYDYGFTVVSFGKAGSSRQLNSMDGVSSQTVTSTTGGSNSTNNPRSPSDDNGNESRTTRDIHRVLDAYMKFIHTFDALHKWAVSAVGILDGEGCVPESGRYVVAEGPHHKNCYSYDNARLDLNANRSGIHNRNDPSSGSNIATGGTETSVRMRTVCVTRYEIHNVENVYRALEAQASLFYASSYTIYDPRVRKRLLNPAYYQAMRDTLRELGCEIDRLQDLQMDLQGRHGTPVTIAFRPTLCEFQYLRDTLRVYWSICLMEDDLTSLQYHCLLYTQCVAETGEVLDMLRQQHCSRDHIPNPITPGYLGTLSPEERGSLEAGFESFWRVRGKVLELRTSLARNITEANRTHCYRVAAVSPPPPPPAHSVKGKESVARRALNAMRTWAKTISCEVDPMVGASLPRPRDDEGVVLSTTSPQSEAKAVLQRHVTLLVSAVETQAAALETEYPGTFYRDARAKWAGRAGEVFRYLESVSVVFTRPM